VIFKQPQAPWRSLNNPTPSTPATPSLGRSDRASSHLNQSVHNVSKGALKRKRVDSKDEVPPSDESPAPSPVAKKAKPLQAGESNSEDGQRGERQRREKEDIRQKADSRDDREDEEMGAEMDEGHRNGGKSFEQRPLPPVPKNLLPWEQTGKDIEIDEIQRDLCYDESLPGLEAASATQEKPEAERGECDDGYGSATDDIEEDPDEVAAPK
jgi:hypothetical protein